MKINKKDILIFLIILFANSSFMLIRDLLSLDELWNYNFARNISEGLLPYKDFNIIITPLFPACVAVFLKFIANELIVSRIVGILLFSCILYLTYKLLEELIKNKWISIILVMGVLFIYKSEFWGDYNFAVLLITLLVLLLEIKNNKGSVLFLHKKYDFWTGVLVGLSILTKQTTGCVLAFTFICYKFLYVKNKNDIVLSLKIALTRLIGIMIPVIAFFIYLICTNSLLDFLDYSVLGISKFTNYFPYKELLFHVSIDVMYKVIGVLIPIFIIVSTVAVIKTQDLSLSILFIFSLQNMIVTYPLFDISHSLIVALPLFVSFIYSIYLFIKKIIEKKSETKIFKVLNALSIIICILSVFAIIIYSIFNITNYFKKCNNDLNHLWGIPIKEKTYSYATNIIEYMNEQKNNGKDVYVISIESVLYMIVLDCHYKDYDMLTKGNFGLKGEEGLIRDINTKENSLFLIKENKSNNRQSTELLRSYIQNNFNKIRKCM